MVKIPLLDKLMKPKEKREIEKEIRELNKKKAELKSSQGELRELGRDDSNIKEEIKKVDNELTDKYNELASLEYSRALGELEKESERKKITLNRMKGELKEEKKRKEKLKKKLEEAEKDKKRLKNEKRELAKKINELEEKLRDREMKVKQQEDIIQEMREKQEKNGEPVEEEEEEPFNPREKLLESLLKKYSTYIEEKEKKTIQEMKELLQPNNINLREYLDDIEEGKTLDSCERAYEKITKEINSCPPLPVEQWMTIKSMLDNQVADYKDKAILICSAFLHFGADAYVAMVKMENTDIRPLVMIEANEKYILVDPNDKHPFRKYYGSREGIMNQYKYRGMKIKEFQYMFSDREYFTL